MSDQFVSTPPPTDLTQNRASAAGEPTLNTSALRAAAKEFLNKPANPAPSAPAVGQPSSVVSQGVEPVSPASTIPVSVSDTPQPKVPAVGTEAIPEDQKVLATDPNTGQKTEVNILDLPDDAIVRMKVNGESVTMSGKEAREGFMKGAKFTREMQQLRSKEEQFTGRLERAEKLEQLVGDDVALATYLFQERPHIVETLAEHMGWTKAQAAQALAAKVNEQAAAPAAPAFRIERPEEIASLGEVDQLVSARASALQQEVLTALRQEIGDVSSERVQELVANTVAKAVRSEINALRDANEIATFDGEIKKTVGSILESNPALKAVPHIEHLMRFEVAKMKPKSPEEMMDAFHTVAQGIVEGLDETYNKARKTTIIDKATMEKTGIQPPVGTAPSMARPINYADQSGKVDFNLIKQAAKAALRTA